MRLATVAGGWHWPRGFFEDMPKAASGADLFVVAHRSPELPIVDEEQNEVLDAASPSPLVACDYRLYRSDPPMIKRLKYLGWNYREEPNTVGDWGFFNQWLARHNYRKYDAILNCHDDTYIRTNSLPPLDGDWLLLGHGKYPEAPAGYVRGSLEFWKPELLDRLGGKIDLGNISLTREGETQTPKEFDALSPWNDTGVPMRQFLVKNKLLSRLKYLSPYYRISPWFIEGERGYIHRQGGAPWSFEAGLKEYPL